MHDGPVLVQKSDGIRKIIACHKGEEAFAASHCQLFDYEATWLDLTDHALGIPIRQWASTYNRSRYSANLYPIGVAGRTVPVRST